MSSNKIIISGAGCALVDFLYKGIDFTSAEFLKYQSNFPGDGGLSPGKLVFTEELERFAGNEYSEILSEITRQKSPDSVNVGGPSLVSLIHASQLLGNDDFEVKYFGLAGQDETAKRIFESIGHTPLNTENYQCTSSKYTPFTDVLSDPGYFGGQGERTQYRSGLGLPTNPFEQ